MKYVMLYKNTVAASFAAPNEKRAQQYARALIKFLVRDIKPTDGSEVTKADFRLRPAAAKPAGPRIIPSNPNYKSKFAPVRIKP